MQAWLQHEYDKASTDNKDSNGMKSKEDLFWSHILEESTEPPEIPEPYSIYLEMKNLGYFKWWSGEYSAQPYIFMREMEACKAGETRFKNIQSLNSRRRAQYERAKQGR